MAEERNLSLRALDMLFSVQLEAVRSAEEAEPFAEALRGFSRDRREKGENSSVRNLRFGRFPFIPFNLIPIVCQCWQQKKPLPFRTAVCINIFLLISAW